MSVKLDSKFTLGNSLFAAVKLTKMLIPISIIILDMVLDLVHLHYFQCQIIVDLVRSY